MTDQGREGNSIINARMLNKEEMGHNSQYLKRRNALDYNTFGPKYRDLIRII